MATYKTILTNKGFQLLVDAEIAGIPVSLARIAIGDGNGNPVTPNPAQTALVREVYRNAITDITPNPDVPGQFSAEVNIPSDIGGFTIREAGIYTEDGDLFAVCNTPSTYKATAAEGAFGDGTVKMVFQLSNAATVNLSIDTSIVGATRQWVINYATPANILPGGLTNQILAKNSNTDGDVVWKDATEGVIVLVDTVEERQTLSAGQTACILSVVTTHGLAVYVDGIRLRGDEWTVVDATHLTLGTSYNAGTPITFVQNEQTGYNNVLRPENNLSDVDDMGESFANLGGQSGVHTYAVDISPTANAVRATYSPAFASLTDGMVLRVKAANANTGAATFAANGMASAPIIGAGYAALSGGEIIPGGMLTLVWSNSLGSWVMASDGGGAQQVSPAVAPEHAMQLGQAVGRLIAVKTFTGISSYTPDPRAKKIRVKLWAGGGGTGSSNVSPNGGCTGAGGGGYAEGFFDAPSSAVSVVVGVGGTAGAIGSIGGGLGGNSSFGTLLSASGGGRGSTTANGVGGSSSGGYLNASGGGGRGYIAYGSGSYATIGGMGGGSYGSSSPAIGTGDGQPGNFPGGGASGGIYGANGGHGADGYCIVEEYT
ncbi:phage tail protein [Bradyrhizobium sp. 613_E4_N2_2]|uniref:phage tail protein n=1 Tax=Bradyrhizobium sp. 613_E4_N2_2 TaxID=3240371 RepID=UPI003F897C74